MYFIVVTLFENIKKTYKQYSKIRYAYREYKIIVDSDLNLYMDNQLFSTLKSLVLKINK